MIRTIVIAKCQPTSPLASTITLHTNTLPFVCPYDLRISFANFSCNVVSKAYEVHSRYECWVTRMDAGLGGGGSSTNPAETQAQHNVLKLLTLARTCGVVILACTYSHIISRKISPVSSINITILLIVIRRRYGQ